jgi:hypothetical protein
MEAQSVVIDGDIDILWRFARALAIESPRQARERSSEPRRSTRQRRDREYELRCSKEVGGAVLLGDLLKAVLHGEAATIHSLAVTDAKTIHPGDAPYWHKYYLCEGFSKTRRDKDQEGIAWRASSQLGAFEANDEEMSNGDETSNKGVKLDDPGNAKLIVLEDSNTGYRLKSTNRCPSLLNSPHGWVILKSSFIDFLEPTNDLWPQVREKFSGRVVLIFTVPDLRFMGLQISRRLSWERTVSDLVREFRRIWNHEAAEFRHCAYIVITLFTAGAVVLKPCDDDFEATLYYDPRYAESEWSDLCDGSVAGNTLTLTAAIALDLLVAQHGEPRSIARGVVAGITAARRLLLIGYDDERRSEPLTGPSTAERSAAHVRTAQGALAAESSADPAPKKLVFPTKQIAQSLREMLVLSTDDTRSGSRLPYIADPIDENGYIAKLPVRSRVLEYVVPMLHEAEDWNHWAILRDRYPSDEMDRILKEARKLAVGPEPINVSIVDYDDWICPVTSFGKLTSVDRSEIEALRAIRTLIENYVNSPDLDKPLSLAVFGQPGGGKSFAIKEVAADVAMQAAAKRPKGSDPARQYVEDVTFNISQFTDPRAITEALHQVRDIGLSGMTPLVFWDEFDATLAGEALGWLRYFLAPMQDGRFQQGPVTHNIGRAIFVFAGGSFETWAKFEHRAKGLPGETGDQAYTAIKGPDFLSRLQGFMDIKPLNYEGAIETKHEIDAAIAFRRAMLLREILKRSNRTVIQTVAGETRATLMEQLSVDAGVVDAFLKVDCFHYGVRSMEAIVKMSAISDKNRFDRSGLAPRAQLAMHVDAEKFLAIVRDHKV